MSSDNFMQKIFRGYETIQREAWEIKFFVEAVRLFVLRTDPGLLSAAVHTVHGGASNERILLISDPDVIWRIHSWAHPRSRMASKNSPLKHSVKITCERQGAPGHILDTSGGDAVRQLAPADVLTINAGLRTLCDGVTQAYPDFSKMLHPYLEAGQKTKA